MSIQIDTAFVNNYRAGFMQLLQQKGSYLRPFVRVEMQKAEFDFYDRIGSTEAQEVTGRHQDTPLVSTPHDRRRCAIRDWDWADLIDKRDKIRLLADPTSPYTMNAVDAFGRTMDDIIIESAFSTAYAGKSGTTTVSFPASQQVPVNYVESGTAANSNMTIAKWRRIKYIMDKNEVPDDDRHIAFTSSQIQSLLGTTEITSSDYAEVKALVQGRLDRFLGFNVHRTERLAKNGSDHRRCIAWHREGLLLAVGMDVEVDIAPRKDKRNSTQVYVCMSMGGTRMEEKRVVEVLCAE